MKDSDLREFTGIMDDLAEMLGGDMSPRKYELYFAALSDLDISDLRKAANHIANTATFFPKPKDFRESINGNQDEVAIAAWEKVLKGKSKAGQYQSVQFDDPVIHTVIKLMGGWGAVCRLEGHDDEKWQRIDFEKTYKAMQGSNADHPVYLPGAAEIQNSAKGFQCKKEVMAIGEKVKLLMLDAERKRFDIRKQ
ncbi:hypothetical protein KAR91_75910 [Candidatus Pacearchaeota archaeon]|nr:hypothetical protein [Candidatus Pacearchaeota archaeon]